MRALGADHVAELKDTQPAIPGGLGDRAADGWELLFAIADLVGRQWPDHARSAAVALSSDDKEANDSYNVGLRRDIKSVFDADLERDEIDSSELCEKLSDSETSPWATLTRGKPVSPARLARMLKTFEIYVCKVHENHARGYKKLDFADAFERYFSSIPPDQSVQVSETPVGEGESAFLEASRGTLLKSEETSTEREASDTLTVSNPR